MPDMIEPSAYCVAALLALSLLAVCMVRIAIARSLIYAAGGLVCAALLYIGIASLGADVSHLKLPLGLPWIGVNLRLDSLAAAFLIPIGLGGAGACLYAIGYGRHETDPGRVVPFVPAFIAGMTLVVLADDAFAFLFAWELMSLTSWALVLSHPREEGNARAAFVYLVMALFSGLTLLLAFGMLAGPAGGFTFAAIRASHLSPDTAAIVFILATIGAGSKAGLVPLHVWLPLAHPAAPSHVSALMSGVMTKIAVYGFIRIVFDLAGPPIWWCATIVLALGGVTATIGVLHALMERDLKRLLAYSTVENIGIVFIGIGLAMAFQSNGFTVGAVLALTAALFHAFNHTLFKSLLFFGAGAVLHGTGVRDLGLLGGLINRMPWTQFAMLAGCIAISAIPPLNGFVSEWMTFQAILLRPELPQWGLKLMIPVDGALLALTAALAAACFVRMQGIAFLGRARSTAVHTAREADNWSIAAMLIFVALCLLFGLLPGIAVDGLAPVTGSLLGGRLPPQLDDQWLSLVPVSASRSSYNGLLVALFVAASTLLVVAVVHRFASSAKRRSPAWDCGFPDAGPASQYTAESFSQPIRRVFGSLVFQTREVVDMPAPGDMRPARIVRFTRDLVWDGLYAPLGMAVAATANWMNVLQFLTIRRYLGFVFVALVLLLLALALWQ
jgi:formate hydrogenlyase subunit 3/multisubunit Na+/H+ antiporter MnhD subunit